ncbi:Phox-like domain containing protein [Phytophthora palmivora]|uniref:Phox-like domain containing protein n=1 Tax=Phytophthora palmivora TaxID=4796 RepID=A0A2P4XHA2_9STRA|nr:Phox-like domain containing protein [Phytophthora palmivora]
MAEEASIAEENVEDSAEAAIETTRETQTITTAYEATEASILSIDIPEGEALRKDGVDTPALVTAKAELADQAPEETDKPIAVATADFTTNKIVEAYLPVHEEPIPTEEPELDNQTEEDPSDLASATKETHAAHQESKESHNWGDNQKEEPESTERRMSSISPEAPTVQTDDAAVTDEATAKATVQMAPTSQATKAVADDDTVAERTPERDSTQLLPHEHMTYEILGVTRANNVIMYHIYTVNSATGERSMSIPKRYSEFKLLNEQLRALDLPSARDLPVLPKPSVASFLRGRRSKKTIEMREKAFGDFLHYITKHEELHECAVFQQFISN